MSQSTYEDLLAQEAEVWNRAAEDTASTSPPDWRYRRSLPNLPEYVLLQIDALLDRVYPRMRALELGCGSGWLTIALARRGATAHGIDIADRAIDMARTYFHSIAPELPGSVTYQVADLNNVDLPAAGYDLVVANGILHHLVHPRGMIDRIHRALKPGGLLWVSDNDGHEAASAVLLAGLLLGVLPTRVAYTDKLLGLLRFGFRAPERIRASMQADGLSPYEGSGRGKGWPERVDQLFEMEEITQHPAVTDYLAGEVRLHGSLVHLLLRAMEAVDCTLVRWGLLHSSGLTLIARKRADTPLDP